MNELDLSTLPVIDKAAALKTAGNSQALADELLSMLCKTLPEEMAAIQQAFTDNQSKELLHRIHKLHGGVSYCCLPRLKKVLMTIEFDLKNNEVKDLHRLLAMLASEVDQVLAL